jgi:hypothetical protein
MKAAMEKAGAAFATPAHSIQLMINKVALLK